MDDFWLSALLFVLIHCPLFIELARLTFRKDQPQ